MIPKMEPHSSCWQSVPYKNSSGEEPGCETVGRCRVLLELVGNAALVFLLVGVWFLVCGMAIKSCAVL